MLAISVWLAIREAIAGLPGEGPVRLDAPATPERVLATIARRRRCAEPA